MPPSGLARSFVLFVALCATAALPAQTRYGVTDLGGMGRVLVSDPLDAPAINASGHVAFFVFKPDTSTFRAAVFRDGAVVDLGTVGGETSGKATAINDAGDVAGASGTTGPAGGSSSLVFTPRRTFVATNGTLIDLGAGNFSSAFGINALRQTIYSDATRGYVFANGTARDLGTLGAAPTRPRGINDAGQIVGFSTLIQGGPRRAFLYENSTMRDLGTLPGGTASSAEHINNRGQIVGFSADASGANRAFLHEDGVMRDLGVPPNATESRALGINNNGDVVGFFRKPSGVEGGPRAFIHRDGAMIDLNTLADLPEFSFETPGFLTLTYATAINDAGQIAGIGSFTGDTDSSLHGFLLTPIPTVQPDNVTAAVGSTVQLTARTTLPNASSFQWLRNGVPVAGAPNERSLRLENVTAATAGIYTCVVDDGNVRVTSEPAAVNVSSTTNVGRLTNLSIRSQAGTEARTLIVGVTVAGGSGAGKPLLIRAAGPALSGFGVAGALADPQLSLYADAALLRVNDDWNNDAQVAAAGVQVGAFAFAASSKDAALLTTIAPGNYSVQITGTGNRTGVALTEIYDATPAVSFGAASSRLTNISARTEAGVGGDILIAGFTVGGATSKTVLIRAAGPALAQFGLGDLLADPKLELYTGDTRIEENDNWGGSGAMAATFVSLGAFAFEPGSKDAALLVTLPPGSYTAQVSGIAGTTGVALVELYELP